MRIEVVAGIFTEIDISDFSIYCKYKWHVAIKNGRYYVASAVKRNGKWTKVYLHRLLKGEPDCFVDHKDNDSLNNKKSNLRLCTQTENNRNRKIGKNNTSGYKGVSLTKSGTYQAFIYKQGKPIYLGVFKTAKLASLAYAKAAKAEYKDFARIK